jgi:hypothetical protein
MRVVSLTVIYLFLVFQIRYYVKMLLSMPFWVVFVSNVILLKWNILVPKVCADKGLSDPQFR